MSYNRDNYNRVKSEFEKKRLSAGEQADARLAEVYAASPAVKKLDDRLASTGIRIFEESIKGKNGLDERIAAIKQETELLRAERARLLAELKLPADYTDIRYECPVCRDTGSVGFSICQCMRRELILAGYESSGIGNLIRTQSFETFDLSFYSGEAHDIAANALSVCRRFADSFGAQSRENLLLRGDTGLGKTHLSTSIAKDVIENGYDVVYDTSQNVFAAFESERFGRSDAVNAADTSRFFDCDLLILDDLGAELSNSFTTSCLYNIINTRINCDRSVIINTNLTFDELRRRYTDRVASRLLGEFTLISLSGTDIRLKKLGR